MGMAIRTGIRIPLITDILTNTGMDTSMKFHMDTNTVIPLSLDILTNTDTGMEIPICMGLDIAIGFPIGRGDPTEP
jgi:hypothetical protein